MNTKSNVWKILPLTNSVIFFTPCFKVVYFPVFYKITYTTLKLNQQNWTESHLSDWLPTTVPQTLLSHLHAPPPPITQWWFPRVPPPPPPPSPLQFSVSPPTSVVQVCHQCSKTFHIHVRVDNTYRMTTHSLSVISTLDTTVYSGVYWSLVISGFQVVF